MSNLGSISMADLVLVTGGRAAHRSEFSIPSLSIPSQDGSLLSGDGSVRTFPDGRYITYQGRTGNGSACSYRSFSKKGELVESHVNYPNDPACQK